MQITEKRLREIICESIATALKAARKATAKNPTEAQKKAGNYRKGHIRLFGLDITLETPKGTYRTGVDKDGKQWKILMRNDYGYFNRTLGKDGDAVDTFLGPNLKSEKVFVIDQYLSGAFDESKVMLGFDSSAEAKRAYLSNYEPGWTGFKYITEVDIETFKNWLMRGSKQRIPFKKYSSIKQSGK